MSISSASELENELRSLLGHGLAGGDEEHSIGGFQPALVARPKSEAHLAATLAKASDFGAAVAPWGAGLQMGVGGAPASYDLALETTGLHPVVEYEPADLTITVGAGITLGDLQQTLDANRQHLPIDGPAQATVGGLFAVGHAGPAQHAYGPPRDWMLGCRVALANGDVVHAGGRVVKNVAGYDLTRMVIGSLGTLGVMTEATFKVVPQPPAQLTLLAACPTTESALELAHTIDARHLALRALTIVENQLACWLAGSEAAVQRTRAEVSALVGDVERKELSGDQADRWWASLDLLDATADVTVRISVPSSKTTVTMEQLAKLCGHAGVSIWRVALPTVGVVIGRLKGADPAKHADVIQTLRAKAEDIGGSLTVTQASSDVKSLVDVWGDVPGLEIMRALKSEFDPKKILNPGRFVGGL